VLVILFPKDGSQSFAVLKIEWLKTRARAHRWKEELILVEEEMRRCLEFGRWKAEQWDKMEDSRQCTETSTKVHNPAALSEALKAYARKHALAERRRASCWEGHWEALRLRAADVLDAKLGRVEKDLTLEEISVHLPQLPQDLPDYVLADDEGED
jgi:hypothetical protein